MNEPESNPLEQLQTLFQTAVAQHRAGRLGPAREGYTAFIQVMEQLHQALGDDWPPEFQNALAGTYSNRGLLLHALGQPQDARADYDAAIDLRKSLRQALGDDWPPAFQNALAGAYSNRGNLLRALGQPQDARADYDAAIGIREALRQALGDHWLPEYQNDLAAAYVNRGNLLGDLGQPQDARADYDAAIRIMKSLRQALGDDWPPEFQNDLATAYSNRAVLLQTLGQPQDARADYDAAIGIMDALRQALGDDWPPEYQNDLAAAYVNRGNLLGDLGQPQDARADYDAAIRIMKSLRQALGDDWPPEYQNDLAAAYSNRGNLLGDLGQPQDARADYDAAIGIREALRQALGDDWPPEFQNALAAAYMNRGILLGDLGQPQDARADYDTAIGIREALRQALGKDWPPEFQNDLATAYSNRAVLLGALGQPQDARADYDAAIGIREALRQALGKDWPPEFQNDLAAAYSNRGALLGDLGQTQAALADYSTAEGLLAALPAGLNVAFERLRFLLLANASHLLPLQAEPQAWASRHSLDLARLLETAPPLGTEAGHQWLPMRETFLRFHLNWLAFCLESGALGQVPTVLGVMQGRELAAALLDRLQDPEALPPAVAAYFRSRERLREVRARLRQALEAARPGESGPGRQGQAQARQVAVAQLLAEEQGARQALEQARAGAAAVPGYEALAAPYQELPLAKIQAALDPAEAMLILLDLTRPGGSNHRQVALVIRHRGAPAAVPLGPLRPVARAVQAFSQQAGRGFRRDAGCEPAPMAQAVAIPVDFWEQRAAELDVALWQPLAPHLQGVDALSVIPHGTLHRLPLTAGAPGSLRLWRYPGLVFFRQQRIDGPKGGEGNERGEKEAPFRQIGLLSHAGDDPAKAIPYVAAEAALVAALAEPAGASLAHPAPFPGEEARCFDLLHFACHGQAQGLDRADPLGGNAWLPALHAAPGTLFSQGDILRAPAQARHVYAGVCLGGHTLEDLDGSPSGLVSAFFQRGAVTVTGALVSIPDEGACLLALLFYRALLHEGLPPQEALERAKGQLARPEGIEDLLSGASLALLRGLRLGPFGQWLNRLYAGAGGSLAERGWASCQRERILERLKGLGIGSEAWQDLVVTLEGLGGDRMALEDWLGQVAVAIPRRELLRPPPQPYLGALLHGMVSFGGRR